MAKNNHKGGESLPLARTSLLATLSSGGHPRNAPDSTPIEAPYALPEGWKWERASNFADIFTGNSINENVKKEKYTGITEGLNFIGTKDVDFDGTINYENGVKISDYENFKTVPSNTPLLCIEGGSAGKKLGITSEQVCFGNKLCAFVCKNVEPKLVYYYLQTNAFFYSFMKERHGLIGGVSVGTLKNIPFPLPPTLAEQQRIVNRIETMFAKLDQAQEKAQSVLDSFETRKAALLHKAFTGELTANWRKENGVSDDSWEEKTIGDILFNIEAGKNVKCESRPPENDEFGIVKVSSVTWGKFDELESKVCFDDSCFNENVLIKIGDFLFSRANTLQLVGNCVIVGDISKRLLLSDKILRFHFSNNIDSKFFLYFTRSMNYRSQVEDLASGNQDGMRNISQNNYKQVRFLMPILPEQQEIVRILDTVLEKESRAKEATQSVLDQIAMLKKSILARAFRGEL